MNDNAPLILAVPGESASDESRVALVPNHVPLVTKLGLAVHVEANAGRAAGFTDEAYREKGAEVIGSRETLLQQADIVLRVRSLGANAAEAQTDLEILRDGQVLISSCDPLTDPKPVQAAADKGLTAFALELVPRITRAQSMDILSSMATVAGYRAVLLAATAAPRMFPMMMTAAGTLKPARVLVVGAGVAGLQAIATAKRLGAVVYGYDIRPAVREQVESLGGKFVELDLATDESEGAGGYAKEMNEDFYRRQREEMKKVVAGCDIVITTAAIPGRKAPVLVTTEMVEAMAPGSVVVDLAAERGGNCEVTVAGETIEHQGVTILGPCNLPADVPVHASEMFSRNIVNFLQLLIRDEQLQIDTADEIVRDTLLCRGREIVHPRIRELLELLPLPGHQTPAAAAAPADPTDPSDSADE